MVCNYTSFSTIFQSYQDDVWVIMKSVCNGTPYMHKKKINDIGQREPMYWTEGLVVVLYQWKCWVDVIDASTYWDNTLMIQNHNTYILY